MPFEKGKPRHPSAGRKKGSRNKSTGFLEALINRNYNIYEAMVELAATHSDPFNKFMMLEKIMAYIEPKKKSLELSVEDLSQEQFAQEAERRYQLMKVVGSKTND